MACLSITRVYHRAGIAHAKAGHGAQGRRQAPPFAPGTVVDTRSSATRSSSDHLAVGSLLGIAAGQFDDSGTMTFGAAVGNQQSLTITFADHTNTFTATGSLQRHDWHVSRTAENIGITRKTLREKSSRLGIQADEEGMAEPH